MQKSTFWLLVALLSTIACHAQQNKADTTLFHPHWEIGVDLLPLLDKENVPSNSLFARRNYFQENGRGKSLRLRAGVEVEVRDFSDVSRPTPDTYRIYGPQISIGHEWQRLSRGFRWFFGVDGFGSYYRQNFEYLDFPTLSFREGGFQEEYKIGIAWVVGFQVKLIERLHLSSETNLSGFYRRFHFVSDQLPIGTGGHSEELEEVVAVRFRPLYVINLVYSIKSNRHEKEKN